MTQEQQLKEAYLNHVTTKALLSIQEADELVNDRLNECEHGSEEYKRMQRASNSLLNAMRSINAAVYEL